MVAEGESLNSTHEESFPPQISDGDIFLLDEASGGGGPIYLQARQAFGSDHWFRVLDGSEGDVSALVRKPELGNVGLNSSLRDRMKANLRRVATFPLPDAATGPPARRVAGLGNDSCGARVQGWTLLSQDGTEVFTTAALTPEQMQHFTLQTTHPIDVLHALIRGWVSPGSERASSPVPAASSYVEALGLFDEDEALDMLAEASESDDIAEFLARVMNAGSMSTADSMDCYAGAAAASLVAYAKFRSIPEDPVAEEWLRENEIVLDSSLIALALAAIDSAKVLAEPGFFHETADSDRYLIELEKVAEMLS